MNWKAVLVLSLTIVFIVGGFMAADYGWWDYGKPDFVITVYGTPEKHGDVTIINLDGPIQKPFSMRVYGSE
jgi:hypothetical protein